MQSYMTLCGVLFFLLMVHAGLGSLSAVSQITNGSVTWCLCRLKVFSMAVPGFELLEIDRKII
jgi:hypothetical protein